MFRPLPLAAALLLAFAAAPTLAASPNPGWHDLPELLIPASEQPRLIAPARMRSFELDPDALAFTLRQAPPESAGGEPLLLSLPTPDGGSALFQIYQSPVMHPALAARYPQIRSYAGRGLDDPQASLRLDLGPRGLHAMVLTPRGSYYIDPYRRGDTRYYQSYFKRELRNRHRLPDRVLLPDGRPTPGIAAPRAAGKGVSIAGQLRTYRLALAADGEYSQFHDPQTSPLAAPDKAVVLAELVNVVNRVSGVYERDLGIRLELIADNDALIFTNPLLDPYIDDQGIEMLLVNTLVLNTLVGSDSYDIGHVVSTGGGGVAGLGVVCSATAKGEGVTGLGEPVGDGFYIDYVAHEMGHQFGANHTFNSETGSCGGGNRNAETAYEPGSGTTIMAYAGICDADDLAPHSDDHFHAVSYDEIVAYTRDDSGASCGTVSDSGNQPPVAVAPAGGFTIPMQTPFELSGSGSDPDGDVLSYHWEQFDLGAAGAPDAPDASAPLFRSFPPSGSPTRVFPQLSDLLSNSHTIGEILPAVSRELNFRLTVRDRRVAPSAGGVASADLKFMVTDTAGPFRVTAPNGGGEYRSGEALDLTWDVAGTDLAPVSCATVDALLSTDGGLSYPLLLAAGLANTGSGRVSLPAAAVSEAARLKLKCSDNVFFDLADADFKVLPGTARPGDPAGDAAGSGGGAVTPMLALLGLLGTALRRRRR